MLSRIANHRYRDLKDRLILKSNLFLREGWSGLFELFL
jgi:hypothetical protein